MGLREVETFVCQEKIAGEYPLVAVVADDESVRESLPDLLREFGFATRSFSSAEEFLTSDSLVRTGCLILDIAMPGMTGFDYRRDIPNAEIQFLDTEHFAIETHFAEIASAMKKFLNAHGFKRPSGESAVAR